MFTPSHFEELEDEDDEEEGEDGQVALLKTCEPRLLWPKRRFLSKTQCSAESSNSVHQRTDPTQEQLHNVRDSPEKDDEKDPKAVAELDSEADPETDGDMTTRVNTENSRFTPSPSSFPRDVFSAVALRIPSTPYFYPIYDTRAAGSMAESSTYGSEGKTCENVGHEVYIAPKKKPPFTIRRPPKHRREEETEDCGHETLGHSCDSFDACWGVRGHVTGVFLWYPMERIEHEGRVDKILVISIPL